MGRPVTSAAFTKVGSYIVSSSDRAIKVWDLKYLKAPVTSVRLPCMVNRLSVSPTVSTIAVPLETGDIMLMDLSGGLVAKIPRSLKVASANFKILLFFLTMKQHTTGSQQVCLVYCLGSKRVPSDLCRMARGCDELVADQATLIFVVI